MLIVHEIIIAITRMIAPVSARPIEPVRGLINAMIRINVRVTAKWAMILLLFFTPRTKDSNKIPAKTGIRAVGDGVCEPRYPHKPNKINTKAFNMLTIYTFIKVELIINSGKHPS